MSYREPYHGEAYMFIANQLFMRDTKLTEIDGVSDEMKYAIIEKINKFIWQLYFEYDNDYKKRNNIF